MCPADVVDECREQNQKAGCEYIVDVEHDVFNISWIELEHESDVVLCKLLLS